MRRDRTTAIAAPLVVALLSIALSYRPGRA
jgi:hypothetical protein